MKLKPKILIILAIMFFSIVALEFFSGEFYFEKFFKMQKYKQLTSIDFIDSHGSLNFQKLKNFQNTTYSAVIVVKDNEIVNINNFDYFTLRTERGDKIILLNALLDNLYSDDKFYLIDKESIKMVGVDILGGKYYLPLSIQCIDRVYEDYKFATSKNQRTRSLKGIVYSTSDSEYSSPQVVNFIELLSKLPDVKNENHIFTDNNGQEVEIIKKVVGKYTIYIYYSYQNLSSIFPTLRTYFYFKAVFLLMLVFVIGQFLDYFLVNPIVYLSKVTERISKLNFKNDVVYHKNDEIGELYFKIDEMADRMENVINLYRGEAEKNIIKKEELEEKIMSFMHEIKTPLSLIMGFAELLKDKYPDDDDIDIIISEAKRLVRLSEETLLLSENSKNSNNIIMQKFDVIPVIKLGLYIYQKELSGKKIIFNDNREIFVIGDREKIEQVIFNLIKNGYHYAKTKIAITIDKISNDRVAISVSNDGKPVPENEIHKIWNKFYTTSNNSQRGLGLYIVSKILKAHNSKYGVINLGHWTKFYFTLQLAEDIKNESIKNEDIKNINSFEEIEG